MAKAKKSKAKSTKTKTADTASTAYTNAYKASTKAAKSAYNFADTSSFFNPEQFQQFFSTWATKGKNFQPANVQQWMEQYAETSQKNIETLTACAQLAAERTKDLLEDQANFFSKFFQETASTVQSTLTSNADPKDKFEEISEYTKYYFDKTASAAKKAAEANMETAQKIGDKLKKRATDAVEELSSAA